MANETPGNRDALDLQAKGVNTHDFATLIDERTTATAAMNFGVMLDVLGAINCAVLRHSAECERWLLVG